MEVQMSSPYPEQRWQWSLTGGEIRKQMLHCECRCLDQMISHIARCSK